jgi:hypothetical protein
MILFPLFATGIIDTGGNLLPVSRTRAVQVAKFATVVIDILVENLPPVLLSEMTLIFGGDLGEDDS